MMIVVLREDEVLRGSVFWGGRLESFVFCCVSGVFFRE